MMLSERGVVDSEHMISHRFPLAKTQDAIATSGTRERNEIVLNP
jgi:hypothetical protein